ncbi:MAG: hypothetical protein LRY46_02000 [Candidatus Pacebacteria bacterium]|nr:hypothetical protein [Candidatus Paceibacterota bacterium]MCD8563578.1 hypothetical protein [Candidatus Paceibacterota bacterium]
MKYFTRLQQSLYTTGFGAITLLGMPLVTYAQQGQSNTCAAQFNTLGDIFVYGTCLLSRTIVPLIISLALVMFMFGMVKFIANAGDQTKREEGRQFMLWSIIGLFVMISIWGIVAMLTNTFGLSVFAIPQFR